jgi:hypothetical protein
MIDRKEVFCVARGLHWGSAFGLQLEIAMRTCLDPVTFTPSRLGGRSLLAVLAFAVSAASNAAVFTFDFDALANNANNAAVQTYMRTIVPGTVVTGAGASRTYTGDGFVIGPTLSTAPTDTFIRNYGSSHFSFDFGTTFHIYSLSFDWEIFPDGTCFRGPGDSTATRTCADTGATAANVNWPDFDLYVGGSATSSFSRVGIATGTGTSPNYPQAIGASGLINLAGQHFLDFWDWPQTIAIDNLVINGCIDTINVRCTPPLQVPEPASLPMVALALALAGLAGWRARRGSRAEIRAV